MSDDEKDYSDEDIDFVNKNDQNSVKNIVKRFENIEKMTREEDQRIKDEIYAEYENNQNKRTIRSFDKSRPLPPLPSHPPSPTIEVLETYYDTFESSISQIYRQELLKNKTPILKRRRTHITIGFQENPLYNPNSLYVCRQCQINFVDQVSMNDHFLLIHSGVSNDWNSDEDSNSDYNPCRCPKCNLTFDNDDDFDDHSCESKKPVVQDTIPQNKYGRYPCPVCGNRYSTNNLLGEHFILSHSNYDDLSVLDTQIHRYGFPGFEILEYIGMFENLTSQEENYLINLEYNCPICFSIYQRPTDPRTTVGAQLSDGYVSDSEIINRRRVEIKNRYLSDQLKKYYPRKISEKKLSEIIEKYQNYEVSPCRLSCCKSILCKQCLQQHISLTDTIICPFCKKDHTRTDYKYIVFIEESFEIDKEKWIDWWSNHVDLFL